jgi:hypothetical protein
MLMHAFHGSYDDFVVSVALFFSAVGMLSAIYGRNIDIAWELSGRQAPVQTMGRPDAHDCRDLKDSCEGKVH